MAVKWPWSRPEVRSANFTDQVISQILSSASGASDGGALAAIETASRIWGSGLLSATVKPDNVALRSVSSVVLDAIGRALCRSGESLHIIDVRNGRVLLTPASAWEVHGDENPINWRYTVTLNGPDTTRMITLTADSVVHVRYAPPPNRPLVRKEPDADGRRHGKGSGSP